MSGSSNKILLVWGLGTGEEEQTHRFKIAAKNLGIDLKVVSPRTNNFLYNWYITRITYAAAKLMHPDLVLIIERDISLLHGFPNYLVLDQSVNSYLTNLRGKLVLRNQFLTNCAGFLPTFPEIDQLSAVIKNYGEVFRGFIWYPTVYRTSYNAEQPQKLFYPGGVLRDTTRGSDKYKQFFALLDSYGYLQVVGKKSKWRHTPNSIQNSIPFDGVSLLKAQNAAGISLVLHDQEHLDGNVPTGRIFEAAAANTVIISDRLKFIQDNFADNVLYVDVSQDAESIAKQIDTHVRWIFAHPQAARAMAQRCHEIFLNKFTLEQQLQKLLLLEQDRKANKILNQPIATLDLFKLVKQLPSSEYFPNYRSTVNSGFLRDPNSDGYVLAFHTDIQPSTRLYRTKMHLFRLNKELDPIQHTELNLEQHYKFFSGHWNSSSTAQDPRFFTLNQQIYMVFNDSVNSHFREIFMGNVQLDKQQLQSTIVNQITFKDGELRDQKNWTPFVYADQLYFIYSTDPHLILKWDPLTNQATKMYDNGATFAKDWQLGELRGGTPAIYVKDLDAYLTFFHSSVRFRERDPESKIHVPHSLIYYTGALIFESKPPFKVIAYTPQPLSYPGLYAEQNVDHYIIFPCGLIEEDNTFLLSAGVQDIKTVFLRINKKDLYSNLKYINQQEKADAA